MEKNIKGNKDKKIKGKVYKFKGQKKEIISDVNGSYTGVPLDPNEMPIQDADDL